jgi:heme o synthase
VVAGHAETRRQILLYSLILVPLTFVPAFIGTAGWLYTLGAAGLGLMFLWHAVNVYRIREGADADRASKKLFGFSILYLFLIFALVIAEHAIGVAPFARVLG